MTMNTMIKDIVGFHLWCDSIGITWHYEDDEGNLENKPVNMNKTNVLRYATDPDNEFKRIKRNTVVRSWIKFIFEYLTPKQGSKIIEEMVIVKLYNKYVIGTGDVRGTGENITFNDTTIFIVRIGDCVNFENSKNNMIYGNRNVKFPKRANKGDLIMFIGNGQTNTRMYIHAIARFDELIFPRTHTQEFTRWESDSEYKCEYTYTDLFEPSKKSLWIDTKGSRTFCSVATFVKLENEKHEIMYNSKDTNELTIIKNMIH